MESEILENMDIDGPNTSIAPKENDTTEDKYIQSVQDKERTENPGTEPVTITRVVDLPGKSDSIVSSAAERNIDESETVANTQSTYEATTIVTESLASESSTDTLPENGACKTSESATTNKIIGLIHTDQLETGLHNLDKQVNEGISNIDSNKDINGENGACISDSTSTSDVPNSTVLEKVVDKHKETVDPPNQVPDDDDDIIILNDDDKDNDLSIIKIANVVSLAATENMGGNDDIPENDFIPECNVEIVHDNASGRPMRKAAVRAEHRVRMQMLTEETDGGDSDSMDTTDITPIEGTTACYQCKQVKVCQFQVLRHGITCSLCTQACFDKFRPHPAEGETPAVSTTPTTSSMPALGSSVSLTPISMTTTPVITPTQPLQMCHIMKDGVRKCTFCMQTINSGLETLAWETMEFCNEACLGKYQLILGAKCSNCQSPVKKICLGKYSVRFGSGVKQFCTSPCLEDFKRGLKVCSYCQLDMSQNGDGFLAPVGDKGLFRDFCSQICMNKYVDLSALPSTKKTNLQACAVCSQIRAAKMEVLYNGKTNFLCSDVCMNAFKFVNEVQIACCDFCQKYYSALSVDAQTMYNATKILNFCSPSCINVYITTKRVIVECSWCKVKKYNFDMIEKVSSTGVVTLLCSVNCLTLHKAALNAVSKSSAIKCDQCGVFEAIQYHITMSDATIRHFCSQRCTVTFQNRFKINVLLKPCPLGDARRATNVPVHIADGSVKANQPAVIAQIEKVPTLPTIDTGTVPYQNPNNPVIALQMATAQQQTVTVVEKVTETVYYDRVLVKPPPPKEVKNKGIACRPISYDMGSQCKIQKSEASTQTDDSMTPQAIVPVPVPIYIPAPMNMYSSPFPVPVPFPLPIPVPIFIPTTKKSSDGILKEIQKISENIPADPYEYELLKMAEAIAEDSKKGSDSDSDNSHEDDLDNVTVSYHGSSDGTSAAEDDVKSVADLEDELPANTVGNVPASTGKKKIEKGKSKLSNGTSYKKESKSVTKSSPRKRRRKGSARSNSKRRRTVSGSEDDEQPGTSNDSQDNGQKEETEVEEAGEEIVTLLKHSFGVEAWQYWVQQKNNELEKASAYNRKLKLFKTELLKLNPEELNYSLCLFVKEVRKPNNDEYAPDSIYYLCLGIQQYLYNHKRIDDIFTDPFYNKFTDSLNEVAKTFPLHNDSDFVVTRIEEEHLWESAQLGAHSPSVLLSTLIFFNMKYFQMKEIKEHLKISFVHVMKHITKTIDQTPKGPVAIKKSTLRYYPPGDKNDLVYEQQQNLTDPVRCPVKLYEFYMSKCPETMKYRNDCYYLSPERSCGPDSPIFYSHVPLPREELAKILNRFQMVKEVNESFFDNETS